jgi:hypothetical protein
VVGAASWTCMYCGDSSSAALFPTCVNSGRFEPRVLLCCVQIAGYMRFPWPMLKALLAVSDSCEEGRGWRGQLTHRGVHQHCALAGVVLVQVLCCSR